MNFMRSCGILMPISSLPSKFGIGTLGEEAYSFVDFLKNAGQKYWQILPIGPTSYGDSPYQSFSTFAGNPYFINPDILIKNGYLDKNDIADIDFGSEGDIDYALLYSERKKLFSKVQKHFVKKLPRNFETFCKGNAYWLDKYALFMAIKDSRSGQAFTDWPVELVQGSAAAVDEQKEKLKNEIFGYKMLQYIFFEQWFALKKYANDNGIKIIGDLPIYVAADSADVWGEPEQFLLDTDKKPTVVAGCPPDAFCEDGQLWGNPVYDWEYMKEDGYSWWLRRLSFSLGICDVIRIDHFRGFEGYYCVPFGAENAMDGEWRKGPSLEFWNCVKEKLNEVNVIAEDLGYLTDDVRNLVKNSGFAGMKVLQFAFDSGMDNEYLPHNHKENNVVYVGTHDNDTLLGFCQNAKEHEICFAMEYFSSKKDELPEAILKAALESPAVLCILTMQDIIGLGSEARINTPSTLGGNWTWRAKSHQITPLLAKKLYNITKEAKRT